ncbi:MAG: hypothetical protein ACI9UO_003005, partial [Nitrospinales bacterium]
MDFILCGLPHLLDGKSFRIFYLPTELRIDTTHE